MSALSSEYLSYVLDRAEEFCWRYGHSKHTQRAYLHWIRRYIEFCEASSPEELDPGNKQAFLDTLDDLAPSTQKQAQSALQFFHDTVLETSIEATEPSLDWQEREAESPSAVDREAMSEPSSQNSPLQGGDGFIESEER